MITEITFDSVYTASGEKNGKPWKRWDFKVGDDRYSTFQKKLADKIETGQPVTIEYEVSESGDYTNRTITDVAEGNQQATQESQNGSQAGRTAPVASGRDFKAEAEGKTRCALVSQLLPAMFTALDAEEQTPEGAQVLLDWAFAYVFQTDSVPF